MPGQKQVDYEALAEIANRLRIHSVNATTACNSGYVIILINYFIFFSLCFDLEAKSARRVATHIARNVIKG